MFETIFEGGPTSVDPGDADVDELNRVLSSLMSISWSSDLTVWTWSSYVPCKRKMAVHWSLGFVGFIRFHSHEYPFHFDSFRLIPFSFISIFPCS